jgi:hypothetical protein
MAVLFGLKLWPTVALQRLNAKTQQWHLRVLEN